MKAAKSMNGQKKAASTSAVTQPTPARKRIPLSRISPSAPSTIGRGPLASYQELVVKTRA
ncbi:MAG: hypothetical protein WDN24_04470 [Sphingomonas sp.]